MLRPEAIDAADGKERGRSGELCRVRLAAKVMRRDGRGVYGGWETTDLRLTEGGRLVWPEPHVSNMQHAVAIGCSTCDVRQTVAGYETQQLAARYGDAQRGQGANLHSTSLMN